MKDDRMYHNIVNLVFGLIVTMILIAGLALAMTPTKKSDVNGYSHGSPFVAEHYKQDYPQKYCRGC